MRFRASFDFDDQNLQTPRMHGGPCLCSFVRTYMCR